jgi:hypothetical protein
LHLVEELRSPGHDGDEESGQHDPECEGCLVEAIKACAASIGDDAPRCATCNGSGFSGRGEGHGDVCSECGGQSAQAEDPRDPHTGDRVHPYNADEEGKS